MHGACIERRMPSEFKAAQIPLIKTRSRLEDGARTEGVCVFLSWHFSTRGSFVMGLGARLLHLVCFKFNSCLKNKRDEYLLAMVM